MSNVTSLPRRRRPLVLAATLVSGLVLGALARDGIAELAIPTEHRGLAVEELGVIPAESMAAQLGLEGYKMQLREIVIEPGGQIARHSHESRPGLVQVIDGTWTEGRPEGQRDFDAASGAILEDRGTEHWFWNTGDTPATALVCDIVPDS